MIVDECGCGSESAESETTEPAKQPEPAQRQKPETPSAETPQPALDPSEELPPAPINVPTTPPTAETESNGLFPGPAAEAPVPADTEPIPATPTQPTPTDIVPPTEPESQPSDNAGGLFDEPAAESAPLTPPASEPAAETETPASGTEATESSSVDDVFGEPAPTTEDSTGDTPAVEEETIEVESTETDIPEAENTEQPAADPLDDLFGPSSAVERPKLDTEAAASHHNAGGLASGEFRQWSNRGSNMQYQGRLIRMTAAGVVVAQPGGEVVAIAFSQLSDDDLAFVRGQVQAQRALLAQQGAESQIAAQNVR